jgi:4-amino-4-deoxy-L-arabinose transferase-like glycosyltransferase
LLLAISVRTAYLLESTRSPTFSVPIVDSQNYDEIARSFVQGKGMSERFFWQPVFYPLFLSLVYWLSGSSILAVKVAQVVLGGFTAVLVYRLGVRLFGRGAGVAAGIIVAIYMPLVFLEGELLAAGWAAFWSVALILLFLKVREKPGVWVCLLLGLCGALSILTRPEFLPFFVAACGWLLLMTLRDKTPVAKLILTASMVIGGFLLAAVPVATVCYHVTGKVAILPLSGGINLYIGNNPKYEETVLIRSGAGWRKLTELPVRNGAGGFYKQDEWFFNKAKDYAFHEPVSFFKGLCHKALQFVISREIPRSLDIYLFREWSTLLTIGVWKIGGFGFPFGVLLPMAVCGVLYWRRTVPVLVWLFILLYPAAVILVFVASRFRIPAVPTISVLAAGGCVAVRTLLQGRQWRRLSVLVVVALVTAVVSMAGPFGEEKLDYKAELYFALGWSLNKQGRTDEAIQAYSKAIELKGDYVEAHNNLGNVLFRLDRFEEAKGHYGKAVEADPNNAVAHYNLGSCLQKQGRMDEAVACYRRAIAIDPQYAPAHRALEDALREKSKP